MNLIKSGPTHARRLTSLVLFDVGTNTFLVHKHLFGPQEHSFLYYIANQRSMG